MIVEHSPKISFEEKHHEETPLRYRNIAHPTGIRDRDTHLDYGQVEDLLVSRRAELEPPQPPKVSEVTRREGRHENLRVAEQFEIKRTATLLSRDDLQPQPTFMPAYFFQDRSVNFFRNENIHGLAHDLFAPQQRPIRS